jgi:hypothetical protein
MGQEAESLALQNEPDYLAPRKHVLMAYAFYRIAKPRFLAVPG